MKTFYIVGDGIKQALSEAEVVRTGHLLMGANGLVESIAGYMSAGFAVIVDDSDKTEPYVLNEASEIGYERNSDAITSALKAVTEGVMDKVSFAFIYEAESESTESKTSNSDKPESNEAADDTESSIDVDSEKTIESRFGIRWDEKMAVFSGTPKLGEIVKVLKVQGTDNIKVGDEGELTKPVVEGKPLYMKMLTGEHKGRQYHTSSIRKIKIK